MIRTGVFISTEELDHLNTAVKVSGMWTSNGVPLGDPQWEVEQLRKKYQMPEGTGLDASNGEFVRPE